MPGDMDATAEIAPDTAEYAVDREPYGGYELNPERFVLEPSIRALRCRVVRGRFQARRGHLVLGDTTELALEVGANSLRTNVLGLATALTNEGALCAADFPALHFRSTEVLLLPNQSIEVAGKLDVLDTVREVRLTGKLTYADDRAVILWLYGRLPPPRRPFESGRWIARTLGTRPIHLELAAEFVR